MSSAIENVGVAEDGELPALSEFETMSRLLWNVDDTNVLDISPLQREIDELIPAGVSTAGFDRILTASLGAVQSNSGSSGSSGGGGILDSLVGLFSSVDPDTVAAVATMAGHPEIAIAAQVIMPMLSGDGPADGSESDDENYLPDYASVMDLNSLRSMKSLIETLRGHARYINDNYTGDTAESLRALLVIAYSQAFRDNIVIQSAPTTQQETTDPSATTTE